jgi:S-adenosylmethionine:diacylglycerol 3-amino-3-carboxypropyl transferase
MPAAGTPWERGRFDARPGPRRLLFGRMYEDPAIELAAFRPGGRVLCIASAGCTAMALAARHEVVAVDLNPVQLAYAARRLAGGPVEHGSAERLLAFGRAFAPLVGWTPSRVRAFCDLERPTEQLRYWRRHLDTRRFRIAFDALLSLTALRRVYGRAFLDFLPRRLGAVLRARLARGFGRHPNRTNPWAHALLLGSACDRAPAPTGAPVRLVEADVAAWLEAAPAGGLDGVTLSNVLDGASVDYARRLAAAVRRAAAPDAPVVLRSFAEPPPALAANRAADDRAMLWGVVDVRPAAAVALPWGPAR